MDVSLPTSSILPPSLQLFRENVPLRPRRKPEIPQRLRRRLDYNTENAEELAASVQLSSNEPQVGVEASSSSVQRQSPVQLFEQPEIDYGLYKKVEFK